MSIDIEARVRRANLVSRDEQLEQLFDDALSPRLLRDVYAKKEGRMSESTDRPQPVTVEEIPRKESQTTGRAPRRAPTPGLVLAGIATVVVVGVVLTLVSRGPAVPATPVEVAESFMTALNAHDVDAMLALSTPELIDTRNSPDGTVEGFRAEIEQEGVLGWAYHFTCDVSSTDVASYVRCPYSFSNHITEKFGLEPYPGSLITMRIKDGEVTTFINNENSDAWHGEGGGLGLFYQWMVENHPEDAESFYYNYTDEANLNFWKKYMPLFLASVTGN